jgi:hypothetical protein
MGLSQPVIFGLGIVLLVAAVALVFWLGEEGSTE